MKILHNDLHLVWERWDDPGDYPSGAGSGPLPGYEYVGDVEGRIEVEVGPDDLGLEDEEAGKAFNESSVRACLAACPEMVEHEIEGLDVSRWAVSVLDFDAGRARVVLSVADFACDRERDRGWEGD